QADDRAAVVDLLVRELHRLDRAVSGRFVRTVALAEIARRHPDGPPYAQDEYLELIEHYSGVRAKALAAKPGRLRAEIGRELATGGRLDRVYLRSALAAALRRFPLETTAAFLSLNAEAQRNLLVGSWRRFDSPAFLPLVRRLYRTPTRGNNE